MSADDPRIKLFGGADDWEDPAHAHVPHGTGAVDLEHHMEPLRLSLEAINQASKIIPIDVWKTRGLVTWLQAAAEYAFAHVPSGRMEYLLGPVGYIFEFDPKGPVLKKVQIGLKTKKS